MSSNADDKLRDALERLEHMTTPELPVVPEPQVARRCFVCDKPIKDSIDGKLTCPAGSPPDDAIMFTSRGNWGSTLFDACGDPEHIEIAICDLCVYERRHKVDMSITYDNRVFYQCETFAEHVKNWRNRPDAPPTS